MGKLDESASHLQNARLNGRNSQATTILINLLERIRQAETNNTSSETQTNTPGSTPPANAEVK
jgi:hypothetical protein